MSYEKNKYSIITILGWHIVAIGCLFLPWFVPAHNSAESYGYFNDLLLSNQLLWYFIGPLFFLTSISILFSIINKKFFQFIVILLLVLTLVSFIFYLQYMFSEDPIPYFIPGGNSYVAEETTLGIGFYISAIGIFIALIGPIKTILDIRGKTPPFKIG